ncbi:DUF5304 domain-containing protein [Streptomyces iconiensis]|uniref:DUF5304 domain-containing protein n=1 Tax=Streptomyces iconiensis TaxID=1384038 RepID=A0ABT7A248_9ACTN|nr:DUF5304 domain-containing protein [Streptomyces iconiensis]MDJ1135376.1 DUF5304 domain-containing protein [Streptomyces iconiensis]
MSDDAERPDPERADAGAPSGSPAPSPADVPDEPDEKDAREPVDAKNETDAQKNGTGAGTPPDADAWATACEEDLAAEKARRRAQYGAPPTSAAEELRRLAEAVTEKVAEFGKPFAGAAASGAAQGVAQQLIAQAKASIEPVVQRNPQLFDHLAAAGNELLAAYRAAVHESERRWTEPTDANGDDVTSSGTERIDLDRLDGPDDPRRDGGDGDSGKGDSGGKGEHGDG